WESSWCSLISLHCSAYVFFAESMCTNPHRSDRACVSPVRAEPLSACFGEGPGFSRAAKVLFVYSPSERPLARAVPPSQTGKGLGGASNHTGEKTISVILFRKPFQLRIR